VEKKPFTGFYTHDTLLVMESISPDKLFDLSQFRYAAIFEGCTCPWDALKKLETYLKTLPLGKIHVKIPEGAFLVNPEIISIDEGSVIEPGAYIKGPCVIGKNVQIRQGAYIRSNVLVGDNAVIGHDTEIKHSIVMNHAAAAHFAYLGDSILGNQVNLGAGTKCANLRLNHQEIYVGGIATGLKKFGAILGDGTQLGCNCVTNPGTVTGKGVLAHPCVNFGGIVPAASIVKAAHQPEIVQP
jgi:NDP-sugar pyrophosphorylase family protein